MKRTVALIGAIALLSLSAPQASASDTKRPVAQFKTIKAKALKTKATAKRLAAPVSAKATALKVNQAPIITAIVAPPGLVAPDTTTVTSPIPVPLDDADDSLEDSEELEHGVITSMDTATVTSVLTHHEVETEDADSDDAHSANSVPATPSVPSIPKVAPLAPSVVKTESSTHTEKAESEQESDD
jgi:hypothetical protein